MCSDDNLSGSNCCFPLNSISYYYYLLKNWSGGERLALNSVSKWPSEDGGSEVRARTSFSFFSDENMLDSMCCFPLNSINNYSCFSKLWSDVANLACNLVSKGFSEDGFSEMRVITSFSMCSDENVFDISFRSSLNCFSYSVSVRMGDSVDGVYELKEISSFPMSFNENLFFLILTLWYTLRGEVILLWY